MSKTKELLDIGAYNVLPSSTDKIHNPRPSSRSRVLRFVIPVTLALCSAAFVLGLVVGFTHHPHDIKVYISKVKIKEFDFINNKTVNYKVEMMIHFRNPNRRASVRYKSIHATGYHEGNRFGPVVIPKFHQGPSSVNAFHEIFEGKTTMPVSSEEFHSGKEHGFIDLQVEAYTRIKYKIGLFETRKHTVMIMCGLNRIALANNMPYARNSGHRCGWSRCAVDYIYV